MRMLLQVVVVISDSVQTEVLISFVLCVSGNRKTKQSITRTVRDTVLCQLEIIEP